MGKYYSMIFYIEKYNHILNQKEITENVVDKICDLLNCYYDKLGYILFHPDYNNKDLGYMYIKRNKEKFYSKNIPSKMQGIKYQDEESSPRLLFETSRSIYASYSKFEITIKYPIKSHYLQLEIDIKKSLLKDKNIEIVKYKEIINILNSNGFIVNTSFMHYYSGISSKIILNGFEKFPRTLEENYIINKALDHNFDWKNKIVDVFLYNTFRKECLDSEGLKILKRIVGKENVVIDKEYITYKYPLTKMRYLFDKYIPSITKIKLRNFFKRNNMTPKKI